MSGRVTISKKAARALEHAAGLSLPLLGPVDLMALSELRAALKSRPSKPARKEGLAKKKTKRADKNAETVEIRYAVAKRAGDRCECGCGQMFAVFDPLEMDHFFPKGRTPQTVENCWALTRSSHALKTRNFPSAGWWLEQFIRHCKRYGYEAEAKRAQRRLDSLRYIQAASEVSR